MAGRRPIRRSPALLALAVIRAVPDLAGLAGWAAANGLLLRPRARARTLQDGRISVTLRWASPDGRLTQSCVVRFRRDQVPGAC